MNAFITYAILNGKNRIIDDHGTVMMFSSRKRAEQHLAQPHIRAFFEQEQKHPKPVRVEKVKISGTMQKYTIEIQRELVG